MARINILIGNSMELNVVGRMEDASIEFLGPDDDYEIVVEISDGALHISQQEARILIAGIQACLDELSNPNSTHPMLKKD